MAVWGGHGEEGRGEIAPRRRLRRALLLVFVVAVTAAPAVANHKPLPWVGGPAVVSPFEEYAGQLASELARRPVKVYCNGSTDWTQLAAQQKFDAVTVWGFVLFTPDAAGPRPADYMQLSEQACWYLDEYWGAPAELKGKTCLLATRIEFKQQTTRERVLKRVKVRGKWVMKSVIVTKTREVPVETPEYGQCPDYRYRIFAIQALAHESMHLRGIADEAQAECQGLQRLSWIAERLGASAEQARQMAYDYFHDFYTVQRPGTPYFLPGCPTPAP